MSEQSYEHQRAIMEGERNASVAALEKAEILGPHDTRPYEMGFTNGWDRALSTHHAAPGAPQQEASEHDARVAAVRALNVNYHDLTPAEVEPFRAAATAPAGGVTDEQIMEAAKPHFKPDAEITPTTRAAYIASVRAVLALTTAARAAEPAIHLGAEGQKVFAETLLNPPPPTAAFLKAEESYSNLVRPEATAPAGGMTDGAERWMAIVREKADDARKNAHGLRQFEGMEAEARARELAAQYLLETAHVMVLDERHAEALAGIVDQSGRIAELRAALTTAARAAEPVAWYTDWPGHRVYAATPHGWNEPGLVLNDPEAIKDAWHPLYAASPTPPTGTSKGEGTS